jgi:integrase
LFTAFVAGWSESEKVRISPFADGTVDFLREQGRERILSFSEERLYLEAANPTLNDVATIILECGSRPEEVFRIRVEDVSVMGRTLKIQSGKTKNARRTVPLTETALGVLKRRISQANGPYIFPFRKGFGLPDWNRPMDAVMERPEEGPTEEQNSPSFHVIRLPSHLRNASH